MLSTSIGEFPLHTEGFAMETRQGHYNAAHIGGLISGFLIGRFYYRGLAKDIPVSRQWPAMLAVCASVLVLAWVSVRFLL